MGFEDVLKMCSLARAESVEASRLMYFHYVERPFFLKIILLERKNTFLTSKIKKNFARFFKQVLDKILHLK